MRTDLANLRQRIAAMLLQYPELHEDEQLRADMFEGETDLKVVLSHILDMTLDAGSMVEAIKVRSVAIYARKARYERKEAAGRNLMQGIMDDAGLTKVVLPEATLSIRHRKPMPFVYDETLLPEECFKLVRKPNLDTIKSWANAGNVPPGVDMSNGGASLTVLVK